MASELRLTPCGWSRSSVQALEKSVVFSEVDWELLTMQVLCGMSQSPIVARRDIEVSQCRECGGCAESHPTGWHVQSNDDCGGVLKLRQSPAVPRWTVASPVKF